MNWRNRMDQSGFSLVELSVAMAVFSMGLGSLSMMLLAAVHGTAEARYQTVAAVQSDSLAEMIAMSGYAYGHYINPPDPGLNTCEGVFCDGAVMAGANMAFWQTQLRDGLPGGTGLVCRDSTPEDGDGSDPSCDGNGTLVIKVFWAAPFSANSNYIGPGRHVSRLPW